MRSLEQLELLAEIFADGHYSVFKFTTNYRVCLGTPYHHDEIQNLAAVGATLEDAVINLRILLEKERREIESAYIRSGLYKKDNSGFKKKSSVIL